MKANVLKKNIKWVILFICLIIFLLLVEDVLTDDLIKMDDYVYNIVSSFISPSLTPLIKIVTNLASAAFLCVLSIILLIIIKNKKIGISILSNLGVITIINLIIKSLVQRTRPNINRLTYASGYSFPSGHSMVSMAFYGYLIYLIYKYVKNKYVKWISIILLSILIILIGISRIYLGVHYTSDVVGGFTISVCYLIIYTKIVKEKFDI